MKIIAINILTVIIILIPSCDILDSSSSSKTISQLDSKILFKAVESYELLDAISIPQIFIEMTTEKIYGCYNYRIVTSWKIEDKSIIINIIGIYKPHNCLMALGPANGRVKLGKISGNFEIKFKQSGFCDSYNLLISDSLIVLDGEETPNTAPLFYSSWRFPEKSFVYLCGTTLSDTTICSDFLDTLKTVIPLTEFEFPDFAEIPYPQASQGHYYDADARYFYYESEEDFDEIQEVLRSYKYDHFPDNNGIGLSIINWMNERIYSWLL